MFTANAVSRGAINGIVVGNDVAGAWIVLALVDCLAFLLCSLLQMELLLMLGILLHWDVVGFPLGALFVSCWLGTWIGTAANATFTGPLGWLLALDTGMVVGIGNVAGL